MSAAPAAYPTTVEDGVVVAGGPAAHTLDLYEDALCPACQAFEQRAGTPIAEAVAAGRVQVRYHLVNLLEQRSDPPGHSTAACNAMICAAESGAFPAVHASLYAAQPRSRARAGAGTTPASSWTSGSAPARGRATPSVVQGGRHAGEVAVNYRQAVNDPASSATGASGRRRSCSTGARGAQRAAAGRRAAG